MNNLKVINRNGIPVVDSREVAEMVGKRHCDLLESIDGYIQYLENGNFRSQNFFIKSSYKTEGNNKTYDCYLLTKKGCDMVANKMTGEKGVLFTATYVTKFEEMENAIKQIQLQPQQQTFTVPKTYIEALRLAADLEEERQRLETQLVIQAPKVESFEHFISAENVQTMNTVAKSIGIGRNNLFKLLKELKILMYDTTPYQKYIDAGYFEVKENTITLGGVDINKPQTYVTAKGVDYLSKIVKEKWQMRKK